MKGLESQLEVEFHGLASVDNLDDRRHMIAETDVYLVAGRGSRVPEEIPVREGPWKLVRG